MINLTHKTLYNFTNITRSTFDEKAQMMFNHPPTNESFSNLHFSGNLGMATKNSIDRNYFKTKVVNLKERNGGKVRACHVTSFIFYKT